MYYFQRKYYHFCVANNTVLSKTTKITFLCSHQVFPKLSHFSANDLVPRSYFAKNTKILENQSLLQKHQK